MNDFQRDFDKRVTEMHKRGRWINWAVGAIFLTALGLGVATAVAAYQAGCVQSMLLNRVCLSSPTLDGALKNVFGK